MKVREMYIKQKSNTHNGKMVSVEVEAVDAPLGYNLLLGWSWVNEMKAAMY